MDVDIYAKQNPEGSHNESRTRHTSLSFSLGDVNELGTSQEVPANYSVTAALNYCKSKILKPYMRLLSAVGLRSLSLECQDSRACSRTFSYIYTIQVIAFIVVGYILQYMACFRRDRGFGYKYISKGPNDENDPDVVIVQVCHGSLFFSYLIPDCLHLFGYFLAILSFRCSDDDQLPSLMERVFLSLSNLSDGFVSQKRLVKTLWVFVSLSLFWMLLSFISVNVMMSTSNIRFRWMEEAPANFIMGLKVLLVICTLWHDVIQATVISNYCLQAQLLASYLHFLRSKVLQQSIQPTDWMRDIEEFKKLLKYFNKHLAPAVCIFTIVNGTCAVSSLLWLLNFDSVDKETEAIFGISTLNVFLWFVMSLAPFIQAARLTSACKTIRSVGHEVRTRPYIHQTTPGYKLDSILLYACSLKLNAKLYSIPISGRFLCAFLTISLVVVLILGQLHFLNASKYLQLP